MKLPRWNYIALAVPLILAMAFAGASLADKPKPKIETVPEGGIIEVKLDQAVASNRNRPGDTFEATVARPVEVDGKVVIPERTQVQVRVV